MASRAEIAAWALAPVLFATMVAVSGTTSLMGDFRAFYCGGQAIATGANPYLEEPLHACEWAARPPAPLPVARVVTLPAPLPPAALLPFVPLSLLPFPLAAIVYGVSLLGAMTVAVLLYARATGVPVVLLNLAFAAITGTQTYFLGQPMPFVLLALAASALLVRRSAWIGASACAVVAGAEPHIALPVLVAMVVALPRTRWPILGCGVLVGLVGAIVVGVPTSIAYVRDVLPAHALANAYEWQFSLTSILTSVGVSARTAVLWGGVMYALTTIVGVMVAVRLSHARGDPAALVIVPPAFAVFGGVHVHAPQLVVAIPALLAVYVGYPQLRRLAAMAVTFVMIPWNIMSGSVLTGFTPVVVGWFAYTTMGARRGLVLAVIAALIAVSVLALALAGAGPGATHFAARAYPPSALAEESWGAFSRAVLERSSLLMQWLRVPVLVGLALGLIALTRAAFGYPKPVVIRESDCVVA
ncbi:MAG: glycosyltransferase 87 family protein [Vulcanimicrobiaceae bacterium]